MVSFLKPEGAYCDPMYCQSKERLNNPRPSFAFAPPNTFVKTSTRFWGACCEARQKMLNPLRRGNIYDGTTSKTNKPVKALQNSLRRLEFASVLKWSASNETLDAVLLSIDLCYLEKWRWMAGSKGGETIILYLQKKLPTVQ